MNFSICYCLPMIRNIAFYALSLIVIVALLLGFNPRQEESSKKITNKDPLDLIHKQLAQAKNLRHKFKLERKIYQADKVAPGLMLLAASGSEETYLIDHELKILHSWPLDAERARLKKSEDKTCKLGIVFGSKWGETRKPWESLKSTFAEFDWQGDLLWTHQAKDILHHDFQYLADDTLLLLSRDIISQDLRKAEYRDPNRWNAIRSDLVEQIDRKGNIIWQWEAWKHLDINSCGRRPSCVFLESGKKRKKIRKQDWLHTNAISFLPENRWYKEGHEQFKPGNLLIMARNLWESYIADRETGEIVWQYGGGKISDGLINGHEARMIGPNLPGAGNIIILDNGDPSRSHSIIKEINPLTKEIVWSFNSANKNSFYSPTGGSAQRLANGNTFISGDNGGDILEVTADGKIVFRFKSSLRISRAKKYPLDYCTEFASL